MLNKFKENKFIVIGFSLPYIIIILVAIMIITLPNQTMDEIGERAGWISLIAPLLASIIGAILVGVHSVNRERITKTGKSLIHAFIFGFLWTSVFHFFITIYLFMQIVYMYAGLRH